ncbi:MAG: CDP-glucose 4,6-dehydratase [Elusimicrobia bacterium]|nr:CDP-glucose 4,6-dehydratase [Elusimicrobiota bacterium]
MGLTAADAFHRAFPGKTVLVTGHTGFKGAWLSLWLAELKANVVGLSLAPEGRPNLYEQLGLGSLVESRIGDVRDAAFVQKTISETKPQIVFHLAAQSLVRRSYRDPAGTFETNVLGTANILEAVRRNGRVRVCQIVTSDKCYLNDGTSRAFKETDPLGGRDPYSASKACAEHVTAAYRESFPKAGTLPLSISSARAGNVIGGGDWAEDRILPDCIRALSQGRPVEVRNPKAVRPWQHVLEPLSGYLWLAARQLESPAEFAEAWNFGPPLDRTHSVRELVERTIRLWDGGTWIPSNAQDAPHEAPTLQLNSTKAGKRLGWNPVYDFEEALLESVKWYKSCGEKAGADVSDFSICQIRDYCARAASMRLPWTRDEAARPSRMACAPASKPGQL